MGRRRTEPSLTDVLLDAPWWVSVTLAACGYIFFYAVPPAAFASNPFLIGIAMMSRSLAWVPAAMLRFVALLAYLRQRRAKAAGAQREPSPRVPRSHAEGLTSAQRTPPVEIKAWSLDALKLLEWKRFELLCAGYYEAMGFTVKAVSHGMDGGIDATLYKAGLETPVAVVQCKAWNNAVKQGPVRELAGVMLERGVKRGIFWSLSGYVGQPVRLSPAQACIQLLDGPAILARILALDPHKQAALLARTFQGDYRTPTCVRCGVKMVPRERRTAKPIWGCKNYPPCTLTLARVE